MAKANQILDRVLNFFETYVCAVLFFSTCAIIFIQVVFRALGLPVGWTEESARYLCIWVIYLAASKGVRNGNHMSVDLLPMILKGKARVVLYIIASLISLAFFFMLCYVGMQVLSSMGARPQYSAANKINMQFAYAAPYVGAGMMIVRALQRLVVLVKQLIGVLPMEETESEKMMKQGGEAE